MQHEESPRKAGVRAGLAMIVAAVVASPMVLVLQELMPSRENTILDELPAILLAWGLFAVAVTGAAKVVYSLVAERRRSNLNASHSYDQLNPPRHYNVEANRIVDRSTGARATYDTPV